MRIHGRLSLSLAAALVLSGASSVIRGTDGRDEINGTDGSDRIEAGNGSDIIHAGAGNDVVIAGQGNDTIDLGTGNDMLVLRKGDGSDTLISGDATSGRTKVIRFDASVRPEDVSLERRATNVLVINYGRDRLIVPRHFEFDGEGTYRIDAIQFAGKLRWDANRIRKEVLVGDKRNQYIVGYGGSEKLNGEEGNDTVRGGFGNDVLYGGAGNDLMYGDDGDDVLVGGEGNDTLRGENGSDVYIYRPGDGMDSIQNYSQDGDVDVVRFVRHVRSAVTVERRGSDLFLTVADTGKLAGVRLGGMTASNTHPIDRIEFREGPPILRDELLAYFPPRKAPATARTRIDGNAPAAKRAPKPVPVQQRHPISTPLDRILGNRSTPSPAPSEPAPAH